MTAVLAAALLVLPGAPAEAAFPGENGKIVWSGWDGDEQDMVCVANPDGSGLQCATTYSAGLDFPEDPAWSSAGTRLALEDGSWEAIYVANADITGATRITTPSNAEVYDPAWVPGDSHLTFTKQFAPEHDDAEIYSIASDGSGLVRLTITRRTTTSRRPGPTGRSRSRAGATGTTTST